MTNQDRHRVVIFKNFTTEDLVDACWDGRCRKVRAGQQIEVPFYMAEAFARKLVNRELLRTKADGTLVYPGGEAATSPKFPEQVPMFINMFKQAVTELDQDTENDAEVESEIAAQKFNESASQVDNNANEDNDDANQFEGKPQEVAQN